MSDMWGLSEIAALIGVVMIMFVMLGLVGSLLRDGVRWLRWLRSLPSRRTVSRGDAETEW